MAVKRQLRFGAIDLTGAWRFEPRFEKLGAVGDGTIPFVAAKKWGFANLSGEVVVPPEYDFAWTSCGGAACVERGGTWSALGVDGKPVAGWRGRMVDGRARSCVNAWPSREQFDPPSHLARFGFVDETGAEVIAAEYRRAQDFVRGLAMVQLADTLQFAYIDRTGARVVEPFAAIDARAFGPDDRARFKGADGCWHFLDRSGAVVIKTTFHEVSPFSEGLASVSGLDLKSPWGHNLVGYIDATGALVIERQFDGGGPFMEGLACVRVESNVGPRFGFIDRTGKRVIEPSFKYASGFCGEVAPVAIATPQGPSPQAWGLVDREGTWRVEPTLASIMPFVEGAARFKRFDDTWGLFDRTGKVIAEGYAEIGGAPFPSVVNRGGKASSSGAVKGGKWGFVDATGREIVVCSYEAVGTGFHDGTAAMGNKVAV